MTGNLDDLYMEWLYEQAGLIKRGRARSYYKLFHQMHAKEFVWNSIGDKSRYDDGTDLRWQFVRDARFKKVEADWLYRPCTVLEMVLGVARRLGELTESDPKMWFAQLLFNLRLGEYTDIYADGHIIQIEEKLETLVWRNYQPNGEGGLFPLKQPFADQRHVEIWKQLNAWLLERDPV